MSREPTTTLVTRGTSARRLGSRDVLERDRILDAAMGLLLDLGPARMRLAELARSLGVVPSALHYHFPGGKDEVIAALFEREESRVLEAMNRAVAAADTPRSRLLALATARLRNAERMARLHRSARSEHGPRETGEGPGDEIQDYVMRRRQAFLKADRRLIAGIFREAAGHGVSTGSIDLLAVAFQGALFNVTRTFSLAANRKSDGVLTDLVDLFLRGVGRSQ
jgi:AcrR family transcriptional regulator